MLCAWREMMKLTNELLQYALPFARVTGGHAPDVIITAGQLTDNKLLEYGYLFRDYEISIDTRQLKPGMLFWALKGGAVDGNNYVADALAKNCAGAVISDEKFAQLGSSLTLGSSQFLIIVPDTLQALLAAARWWRARFTIPFVGITGSIGKTTTKEMVRSIAQAAGLQALITQASYNTDVGLSLTLLSLRDHHKAAVFEMGVNDPGEMDVLVDLVRPTIGLITCVAHSHMNGLGDIIGIAREKNKIFKLFSSTNVGIIFGDQPILEQAHYHHPIVRFGLKTKNHIQARRIHHVLMSHGDYGSRFTLKIYDAQYPVTLNTPHTALINNAVAAAAIGHFLGIEQSAIVKGLEQFQPFKNRYERKTIKGERGVIMSDCYNASPESMRAALKTFHELPSDLPKIAVLGDMLELGEKERFWHRQVGRVLCKAHSVQQIILVGKRAQWIAQTAPLTIKFEYVDTWQEAEAALERLLSGQQRLVLVKASKAVGLQNLVERITL